MSKVILEVKAIIYVNWRKCLKELNAVNTWHDVDTDISIWEVIADVKAIPSNDSN